ncbi:hypothetical protein L218DRAFT_188514 [Marasmius fiardii PR-910]|nr:hypothetical protein L218DRAFT_188514 [Marasmius fiardii PR-910]
MSMWPFNYAWPRPFDGKPPPVPADTNPRQWLAGNWMPNPAFNWQQPYNQARNTWVPVQQGGAAQWPQQQNQQSFNPYKRVPKPPSAEYLATKLSDNPLGLTNMVSREELYGPSVDGIPPETPWVWRTQALDDEDEDGQQPGSSSSSLRRNPSTQSRHSSTPTTSSSHSHTPPSRHSSEPASSSSRIRTGSSSASAQAHAVPTPSNAGASASANPPNPSGEVEDVRELRPTFSPRIVRTPQHYSSGSGSTLSRSNSLASVSNEQTLSSVMERMSTNDGSVGTPPRRSSTSTTASSRQSSLSSTHTSSSDTSTASMSGVETLSDEPAGMTGMLSPLVMDTPHLPTAKPLTLGRNHTAPTLTSIPEDQLDHAPPRLFYLPHRHSPHNLTRTSLMFTVPLANRRHLHL